MDSETKQLEFAITRILDCGFIIEEAVIDEPTADLGYAMTLAYDVEQNWVQMNIRADFKQPKGGVTFLTGTVLTRFAVKDLKSFVRDGIVDFPKSSLETLFSISFGHMRAIIAKNCAGSRFSNILVPAINPTELFPQLYNYTVDAKIESLTSIGLDVSDKKAIELFDVNIGFKINSEVSASKTNDD